MTPKDSVTEPRDTMQLPKYDPYISFYSFPIATVMHVCIPNSVLLLQYYSRADILSSLCIFHIQLRLSPSSDQSKA